MFLLYSILQPLSLEGNILTCNLFSPNPATAHTAEIITHEDGFKASYLRGIFSLQLSEDPTQQGAMLAASISEDESYNLLKTSGCQENVSIACINSPKSVTLSGDSNNISLLEQKLVGYGKFARKLLVSTAYHSPHMLNVAHAYLASMNTSGL